MKCACEVQRASRKPQRATNALKTLCEPGASHNRNPHAAMTAARLCESQTQRATASRKPQPRTSRLRLAACGCGLHLARAVKLAATPAWLARGRCNPQPASRNPQPREGGKNQPTPGKLLCGLAIEYLFTQARARKLQRSHLWIAREGLGSWGRGCGSDHASGMSACVRHASATSRATACMVQPPRP